MNKIAQNRFSSMIQHYRNISIPADLSETVIQANQQKQTRTFFTATRLALSSAFAIMLATLLMFSQVEQVSVIPSAYPTLSQLTDTQNWTPLQIDILIPHLSDLGGLPDLADTSGIDFSLPANLHNPGSNGQHQSYNIKYRQHT